MFQCENLNCGRRFRRACDFEDHGRRCRSTLKYICSDFLATSCKYNCYKPETFEKHLETKHDARLFRCDRDPENCTFATFNFSRLADHILSVHDKPPEIEKFGFGPGYDTFLHPGAVFPIPILFDDQPCSVSQGENHSTDNYARDYGDNYSRDNYAGDYNAPCSYRSSPNPPELSRPKGSAYPYNYNPEGIPDEVLHMQGRFYY